jgi:flagellar basal-body rod protein FlgB
MFENLDIFRMSSAMAAHAGQKQAVVAQNVANSDTPGYVARDIPSFKSSFVSASGPNQQRVTRDKHLNGSSGTMGMLVPLETNF